MASGNMFKLINSRNTSEVKISNNDTAVNDSIKNILDNESFHAVAGMEKRLHEEVTKLGDEIAPEDGAKALLKAMGWDGTNFEALSSYTEALKNILNQIYQEKNV